MTSIYYDVLHFLEEDGVLDLAYSVHLFCVQYVFIPRIQNDLNAFIEGWNEHSLRTEHNLTPNQLWEVGQIERPAENPDYVEVWLFLELILVLYDKYKVFLKCPPNFFFRIFPT